VTAAAGTDQGVPRRGRKPASGDPVVDRALSLLAAFDATHRSLSLAELSRRSGLPLSTALRLASRLCEWGALERGADGRFVVGLRLLEVASLAPRGHGLREAAMPFLTDLAEVTGHHVLLAVLDGQEALLVERLSTRKATPVLYRVGGRMPLYSTGVGLVLLAFAPPKFQEEILALPLVHEPEKTPVSSAALRRTLAQVRSDGQATVRRKVPAALVTVAAPVMGAEETVIAALSVVVPAEEADPKIIVPAVRTTARAVSRAMGARLGSTLSHRASSPPVAIE
jgi:DNA-binding IclR family transcriptional regulator